MEIIYNTSAEQDSAIADAIAITPLGAPVPTPEQFFLSQTEFWLANLVNQRRLRIKELAGQVYQFVATSGTPEEKAFIAQMQAKYGPQG